MVDIFSADGWLNKSIVSINDFTWSYILVAALYSLCVMVYVSYAFRAVSYGR